MLAEQDTAGLDDFCTALHPGRTAEFMEGLTAEEAWLVLQHAELSLQAEIFGFMAHERQLEILQLGEPERLGALLAELPADDRVDLLNGLPEDRTAELLPHVPVEERREVLRLQAYPEGTAGAVMTTEIAKLPESLNVRDGLSEIARQSEGLETIYYVYIVDDEDHLRGLVSARRLISSLHRPDTPIAELMERDLVVANVNDDQEAVAEKVAHFDLLAIPVVDASNRLLGIITHDDVIDVLREEATEDAHRLSAVEPLERGYMETSWATLTWNRGIWLVILFFAALLTAFALDGYEEELRQPHLTWLVMFIPLVISSGGNTGSQSATLIITALTTGNVRVRDWPIVLKRELIMGFWLGSFLGLIGFFSALVLTGDLRRALVIPLTLILVVICGTMTGSLLPLIFQRLGRDPALMSNPFVAGIIDIVGIVIYMNVALTIL